MKEYRIKAVHTDTQHFTLRRKLAVDLGHVVIAMSHEHTQKFQVSAADQVTRCKGMPEQVCVQTTDPSFFF